MDRRVHRGAAVWAPAFLLLDPETQDAQVTGWGRVLAGLCQSTLIGRAQILESCVPDSGDALRDYHAATPPAKTCPCGPRGTTGSCWMSPARRRPAAKR